MGVNYMKQGANIDIFYDGHLRETGLTVQGNFYKPNGDPYGSNPYSFTHQHNGIYKLTLTATSDNGFHHGDIAATDSGKEKPNTFKFRVELVLS